jgi:Xaa-Pro aminopeptidase
MTLVQEKVQQAIQILNEKNVDAWLTFVRETSGVRDPVMDFIFGPADLTWESILLITRTGDRLAIVGRFEADAVSRLDVYGTVTGYDESIRPHLNAALEKFQPQTIAINTSRNNVHADGLTHGLYEILRDYLTGTPYADRLASSEEIINALRGRKTPAEAERIRRAVATTAMIYGNTFEFMQVGMTEEQVGACMSRWRNSGWKPRGATAAVRWSTPDPSRRLDMADQRNSRSSRDRSSISISASSRMSIVPIFSAWCTCCAPVR